jgi:hypothetical protein
VLYLEDSQGAILQPFEPDAIIAYSQPKVSRALQLFDVAVTGGTVVCHLVKDVQRLLAIDAAEIVLRSVSPVKQTHKPNSRSTSS